MYNLKGLSIKSNGTYVDVTYGGGGHSQEILKKSGDQATPLWSTKVMMDKPTIVYCKSGARSSTISNILTKNNFQEVYSLKGGFDAWISDNLPISKN